MEEPNESATTSMDMDLCQPTTTACYVPKLKMDGNEWLDKLFVNTRKATKDEVIAAFEHPKLDHMKIFYLSELASGENKCGGGLMYLAGRAFQQAKDSQLADDQYPDYNEAKWQVNYMIQYQSMNERQRQRQSHLDQALISWVKEQQQTQFCLVKEQSFFKVTYLPPSNQLGRFYGSSGQHSIYNGLPAPRAENIDGVAYVSPLATVAFVMGMGIPIDDIVVTADSAPVNTGSAERVHNVDQCQKAAEWYCDIQKNYYGSEKAPGVPPKHPAVICLTLSDWSDGFDSAKVKSNRSAIQSKTFTVSPPKHVGNGTDNTFAVALGLKKAPGWKKVEELFRMELEELTQSKEPILLYHGVLQKMVPCFFKRFAVLSDKAERNILTGTLGCGSNLHKCFGVSGNIQTPSCRLYELEEFLNYQKTGANKAEYGWAEKYIEKQNNNGAVFNGAVFPSCKDCRRDRLLNLLGLNTNTQDPPRCKACHDWELVAPPGSGKVLKFPAHKDYPKYTIAGSPVPPPSGRDIFGENVVLPFLDMSWDFMIQACKFAFYQASREKKGWTKGSTVCYLKHCGVSNNLADQLYDAAKESSKGNGEQPVNYNSSVKIGNFYFDPAWLSKEITLQDFIEAIMHQVFLGATESNHELITTWLSDLPKGANASTSGFLKTLQELIKDLRGFGLSWLVAYPLTGQKGKLGTGSWVAENWVFLVRVSQFIYGWCQRDRDISSKFGGDDMSRMVISFHAFVARCLTHSGVDEKDIAETELYLKEFLSSLREFDVRVRFKKLNKPATKPGASKVSELKGTEAWWLKPNYMSLRNLLYILRVLGPLVLWWDGGGRGERFIQLVKPFIKRGVRGDALNFFVTLLGKLFRVRIIDIFEKRYELDSRSPMEPEEESTLGEILDEIAEILLATTAEDKNVEEGEREDEEDEEEDEEEEEQGGEEEEEKAPQFSHSEIHGMTKTKAFYIYRNELQLNESLLLGKPISGIVVLKELEGKTAFEFQVIYRKPVKQLARRKAVFNDRSGTNFHGMWCAPLEVEPENEEENPPFTDVKELHGPSKLPAMKELQSIAKMSAVAIPLSYILGGEHKDSKKFCVITNWWKYRMEDGSYHVPTLDPKLYVSSKNKFDIDKMFRKAAKEGATPPRKATDNPQYGVI